MSRTLFPIIASAALALAACSSASSTDPGTGTTDPTGRPAAPAGALTIGVDAYTYKPNSWHLKVGVPTTIFITNDSDADHDMKSDIPITGLKYDHAANDASEQDDNVKKNVLDVDFDKGGYAQFTFTPTKAGTYDVTCDKPGHKEKGMVGVITVDP